MREARVEDAAHPRVRSHQPKAALTFRFELPASPVSLFLLILATLLSLSGTLHADRPSPCPADGPPNRSLGFAENHSGRRNVEGDYLVIEYDADGHKTAWFDYHHSDKGYGVPGNGSFLPVVFTREKIAVRVCNLHFTDQLTVTTSPLAVPEGGADIRGATPTPLTPLTNTLDALQTSAPSGGAAQVSGVGFSATQPLTTLTVSGVTQGAISGTPPTYTGAGITVSGRQLAQLLYGLEQNAEDLSQSIAKTSRENLPGGILSIRDQLSRVWAKIQSDTHDLPSGNSLIGPADVAKMQAPAGDFAAFDEDLTTVQSISAELTNLAGSLSTQGFGTRAVAIQNNYATILGILELVRNIGLNCVPPKKPESPPPPGAKINTLTAAQIGMIDVKELPAIPAPDFASLSAAQVLGITGVQISRLSVKQLEALFTPRDPGPPSTTDQLPCSQFEAERKKEFLDAFQDELIRLTGADPVELVPLALADHVEQFENKTNEFREKSFQNLQQLKSVLLGIDNATGTIFDRMNNWYNASSVEQTDLIQPASSNTLMRISIVVQRGYTPFTLTSNAASTASSPTTAPAAATATTSTPAHGVKTILVEVHRLANFNMAGGVLAIHVPTASFAVGATTNGAVIGTTTATPPGNTYGGSCGTAAQAPTPANAATFSCILQTQKTNWQVAGLAGLTWYPWGRDYFPRHRGYTNYARNYIPGILIASSITSFGTGFGGLNFEPFSGIDFYGGIASANRNVLPSGISTNTMVPTGYTLAPGTQVHVGVAAGIGFDLSVFTSLFTKTTAPTLGLP